MEKLSAKEKIVSVYEKYLDNNTMDSISVGEICKEAGINRTTFYKHFPDVSVLRSGIVSYYTDSFAKDIVGEKTITSYSDFNDISLRYLQFLDDKIHYIQLGVLKNHFYDYVKAFGNSMAKAFYDKIDDSMTDYNIEPKRIFVHHITSTIIYWSLAYINMSGKIYTPAENIESIIPYYTDLAVSFIENKGDPYTILHPDKIDIIVAVINYGLETGKKFKSVSQLCNYSGINRQSYYRQCPAFEKALSQVYEFSESYIFAFILKNAFKKDYTAESISFIRPPVAPYHTDEQALPMAIERDLLDSVAKGIYTAYSYVLFLLEEEGVKLKEPHLYFNLFYYVCTFVDNHMFYYCNRDKEKLNEHLKNMKKYRDTFSELDEILAIIYKKVTENKLFTNC